MRTSESELLYDESAVCWSRHASFEVDRPLERMDEMSFVTNVGIKVQKTRDRVRDMNEWEMIVIGLV